mgnify:FL=1
MATIIEIKEDKLQNLSEYAEKVLKYGGKMMQCLEELESKSKYNEYRGTDYERGGMDYRGGMRYRSGQKDRWDDEPHYNRYY